MSDETVLPQVGATNGHVQALAPVPSEEWQRVEQAYREIQRRDGGAERHAWQWQRGTLALLGLLTVCIGVMTWQFVHHRDVQAFVQVVQVDEKGALVQTGIPQDLLAYTPPDGLWMDMLAQWVRIVRWRGTDATLAHAEWAWA